MVTLGTTSPTCRMDFATLTLRTLLALACLILLTAATLRADEVSGGLESTEETVKLFIWPGDTSDVATIPKLTRYVEPKYPRDMKRKKIGGEVWIRALVSEEGLIRETKIDSSSNLDKLDRAAVRAAWLCRYWPATQEGKPVAVWVSYKVTFSVADYHRPHPSDSIPPSAIAEMTFQESPKYPGEAKHEGTQGAVWVKALVSQKGKVDEVRVYRSSGSNLLDIAALEAAVKCKYKPAIKGGKPVAMWVAYKVEFSLSD